MSATSHPKAAGSQRSLDFWDPCVHPYGLTYSDEIRHSNTCRAKRVSRGQPLSYAPSQKAGSQSPHISELPTSVRMHGMRNIATKFCLLIKLRAIITIMG